MKRLMPGTIGGGALRLAGTSFRDSDFVVACPDQAAYLQPFQRPSSDGEEKLWISCGVTSGTVWTFIPPAQTRNYNFCQSFSSCDFIVAFSRLQELVCRKFVLGSDYLLVHCHIPPLPKYTLLANQSWFIYAFEVKGNTFWMNHRKVSIWRCIKEGINL